jgi:hypothetical protein
MTRLAIFSVSLKAEGRMCLSVILFKQTHISAPGSQQRTDTIGSEEPIGSPLISVASPILHQHTDDTAQGRLSIKPIELTHTGDTRPYR